jgi:hypothetical protein
MEPPTTAIKRGSSRHEGLHSRGSDHGRGRGAVAAAEAARPWRLVRARICQQRFILHADVWRPGCDTEAAERHLSLRLAILGKLLLAVWPMTQPRQCPCGSGEFPDAVHDGYSIFMFYACSKCYREKRSKYRADIFEAYETDEQIEDDY